MIKNIIGLSLAALLAILLFSSGALAFINDSETSINNRLAAGTLDLKTNNADGTTQTLYAPALKPNVSVGPATIVLKNAGSVNGAILNIALSYTENDGSPNVTNMNADSTAAIIEITALTWNGANVLGVFSDGNGNGYRDIQDLKNAGLNGLAGLDIGASKNFVITIKMRDGINNNFQADGINMTMSFILNQ